MPKIRDDLVGGVLLDDGDVLYAGAVVPSGVDVDASLLTGAAKQSDDLYKGFDKAALEAEVDKRNAGREEDGQIVVGGTGTKKDLLDALEADDSSDN